jgi:hypothetical protein
VADKPKAPAAVDAAPKRLNRAVPVSEALGRALDPALRKRGFASRDLLEHWGAMAPAPYDKMARPDKLNWPRGERGVEGAVLYLSCHPGHALALAHEGERVASAINRYFGYLLVGHVRISATPFIAAPAPEKPAPALPAEARAAVERDVEAVGDPNLRDALRDLGLALARRR